MAVAPAVVLLTAARDRLPDPVASHFGPSGAADGFMSTGGTALAALALGVGLAVVFGACSWFPPASRPAGAARWDVSRWFVGIAWGTAAFLGAVLAHSVAASLDLSDSTAAVLPGTTFPLALVAAVVAGGIGGLLAPRTPVSESDSPPVPELSLGATEQASWTVSVRAPWLPVAGGLLVAGGIALAAAVTPAAGVAVAVAGIAAVGLGTARVTVDRRGLTVSLGPVGRPRVRIPAEDVAEATVSDVSPAQFGGWGYRIVPGGHGVILRSGEALVVTRRSGRSLTVTVDGAATAARLLSAVAARTARSC